ncbi:MAG TPA: FAD-binding and (Fe-S)-binding domain-containing protein [Streptosporangiaceae bacterium]
MTDVNPADIARALRAVVKGGVDDSARRRAEYSSDASNYRVVPAVVVFPRDTDDILAAAEVARRTGTPLTTRGGGTSIAGNSVGTGIVLDTSRHLNRVLDIDPEARTARVEPGVVLASLQAAARPHRLRFGPEPSTWSRATLGGMIGNNSCGAHALTYGRTADNVLELDVLDGTGRRFTAGQGLDPVPGLDALVSANLKLLRTEFGRLRRQVSGYSLEHLLPEHGADLAKTLAGTEGTVVTVLGATVRLVPVPPAYALAVLGYPDVASAADAAPALLGHAPLALEGLDARLVDVVRRRKGPARVPALPAGDAWLMVQVGGESPAAAMALAEAMVKGAGAADAAVIPSGPEAAALWRVREDGAGLGGRTPDNQQAWPGWEDAAVPPERLGGYLREFRTLLDSYSLDGLLYGHFGDGCVHVRIDFPLDHPDGAGLLRRFMTDAAHLVTAHGGSLSGEHGDGRARSELLPVMYSEPAVRAFGNFKQLLDPADLLNPGVLVRPRPLDADLRRPGAAALPRRGGFAFGEDSGDFTTAVHRCVGVGKCRADSSASGGFMCPSYLATRDEKDSTRGRARVLQEMAAGRLVTGGWRAPEVRDVLDLCLSCKACATDCPAGVDMAQYKAEVSYRAYRRRLRPRSHYALGWLPRWSRWAGLAPGLVNAVLGVRPVAAAVLTAGGMDRRRAIPRFAAVPFRRSAAARRPASGAGAGAGRAVVLWADSFSDGFDPGVAEAALAVLRSAGYQVIIPAGPACCGLTWISTGQLDGARRRLGRLLSTLGPYAEAGTPIVGLEPSCTAVLRSDLGELFPGEARAAAVVGATRTLAELLTAPPPAGPGPGWALPDLAGVEIIAQPHCHHYSVLGYDADRALLTQAGATVRTLAGCCGLAGNFGMERGHYEVSVAVAGNALLPALRTAPPGAVYLADGFSCRTQAEQLAGVRGVHLAELLASRLPAADAGASR